MIGMNQDTIQKHVIIVSYMHLFTCEVVGKMRDLPMDGVRRDGVRGPTIVHSVLC